MGLEERGAGNYNLLFHRNLGFRSPSDFSILSGMHFKNISNRSFISDGTLVMGDVTMDDAGVPLLTIDARDGSVIQRVQAGWAVSMGDN